MKVNFQTSSTKFEPNAFYDRLIQIRRTDRKTFDGLSSVTHAALAEYEKARRASEMLAQQATRPPA
jgi:hypothetical protein